MIYSNSKRKDSERMPAAITDTVLQELDTDSESCDLCGGNLTPTL